MADGLPTGTMRDAQGTSEAESLPVHVAACAERYRTLFNRLTRIEDLLLRCLYALGALLVTVSSGVLIAVILRGLEY